MTNAQTQFNKTINDLQKKIKIISSDLRECDKEIATLSNTQHQLDEQSSSIKETCDFLEKRQANLLQEYERKYNKKNNVIKLSFIIINLFILFTCYLIIYLKFIIIIIIIVIIILYNQLINAKLILQKRSKLYTEIKKGTLITNPLSLNDKKVEYKKIYEKISKINNVVDIVEVRKIKLLLYIIM